MVHLLVKLQGLILASEEFVNQNNIQPLGQLMGYGNSLDGYKITAPDPSGISKTKAIENALSNSGLKSSQIDYINAHGTGTRHNDELELRCIGFGDDEEKYLSHQPKYRHGMQLLQLEFKNSVYYLTYETWDHTK